MPHHNPHWFWHLEPTEENKIYLNALNIIFQNNIIQLTHFLKQKTSLKQALNCALTQCALPFDPEKEWRKLEEKHVNFILLNESTYPTLLKEIDYPPLGLYLQGQLPKNNTNYYYLSIVGTRKISSYGKIVLESFIPQLIKFNFVIVSGLALGSDTLCHDLAIKNNGYTIAILGSGLNNIYPTTNINLANKIIEQGALISELPLTSKALKYNFPWRNRIISGFSPATLIIEAPQNSGSLITAQFALNQNRNVLAIPGSIFNNNCFGNNKLIQQGAKLVMSIEDILEEYNIDYQKQEKILSFDNELEKQIYQLFLQNEVISVDKIIENINLNVNEALSLLTNLEFKGIIQNIGYGQYRKIK